jgi:hypothetical protein
VVIIDYFITARTPGQKPEEPIYNSGAVAMVSGNWHSINGIERLKNQCEQDWALIPHPHCCQHDTVSSLDDFMYLQEAKTRGEAKPTPKCSN